MRKIDYIFIHCTASSQKISKADLLRVFRQKGWRNPGYHYAIAPNGERWVLLEEGSIANGVAGYNSRAIHVAYVGGIDQKGRATDNRTPQQKAELLALLRMLHHRYRKARILGHRDISPDTNRNGRVDAWERIKECPCFDAIPEYAHLLQSPEL